MVVGMTVLLPSVLLLVKSADHALATANTKSRQGSASWPEQPFGHRYEQEEATKIDGSRAPRGSMMSSHIVVNCTAGTPKGEYIYCEVVVPFNLGRWFKIEVETGTSGVHRTGWRYTAGKDGSWSGRVEPAHGGGVQNLVVFVYDTPSESSTFRANSAISTVLLPLLTSTTNTATTTTFTPCENNPERIPMTLTLNGKRMTCSGDSLFYCRFAGYGELLKHCRMGCGMCSDTTTAPNTATNNAETSSGEASGSGNFDEEDINVKADCSEDPCDKNSVCDNTTTSYRCTCNEGFSVYGSACVASCVYNADACSAGATCNSSEGCVCKIGFEGTDQHSCIQIDECSDNELNTCSKHAKCEVGLISSSWCWILALAHTCLFFACGVYMV
jgi:fibulin 1/2